jgi:hypothetical protein
MSQSQIVIRRENPVLKNIPVVRSLVKTGKKLSVKKVVGDFSLLPTTAMDLIGLIGHQQLEGIRIPTSTKSAKKGFRMVAKW